MLCFVKSLVIPEKFQHILRVMNTNIDGRRKVAFALTAIKVNVTILFLTLFIDNAIFAVHVKHSEIQHLELQTVLRLQDGERLELSASVCHVSITV